VASCTASVVLPAPPFCWAMVMMADMTGSPRVLQAGTSAASDDAQ
jgi:hypothetical protein